MKASTLIQTEATIVTVQSLKVGDVYMRLDSDSSFNENQLKYGVITNILHNGEDAAIVAIERAKAQYSDSIEVKTKVFNTNSDLKLFHADLKSFDSHVQELKAVVNRQVEAKQKELESLISLAADIDALDGVELTEASSIKPLLEA